MADPISITGLVISISQFISSLYDYSCSVRDCKDDIQRITMELFALKGVLDHIESLARPEIPKSLGVKGAKDSSGQYGEMLRMTHEAIKGMQERLTQPTNSFQKAKQSLTWPFVRADIDKLVASLERAKTWFILVIMGDTALVTTDIFSEVQKLSSIITDDIISRKTNQMFRDHEDIMEWLAPIGPEDEHTRASRLRVPGTGQWFVDGPLSQWFRESDGHPLLKDNFHPILWVTGKSGAGKTTLFSRAVEEIQARCGNGSNQGCGFFYCSQDNAASQQTSNVIGSIIAQLTRVKPEIVALVQNVRKTDCGVPHHNKLALHELEHVLGQSLVLFDRIFILLDALNETPHATELINSLSRLSKEQSSLRILMTCTADPPEVISAPIHVLHLKNEIVDSDIRAYVTYRLDSERVFSTLSPTLRGDVGRALDSGANGMFRWAQLSMDQLVTLRTGRDIRNALTRMPMTLNESYARLLKEIPHSDKKIVKKVLIWLSYSARPLSLRELSEAVVLQETDRDLDSDSRISSPGFILDICRGLVESDQGSLKLCHDSIRSFLSSKWICASPVADFYIEPASSHREIMRKCLAYLSFDKFAKGCFSTHRVWDRFRKYPLITYAAQFWPVHAEEFALDASDEQLILSFFTSKQNPGGGSFDSWVQMLLPESRLQDIARTQPLYYAASYNMVRLIKLLLKSNPKESVDQRGGRHGSTPLFVACFRGNSEAAKLLVEAGADPNLLDNVGLKCYEMAEIRNMYEVVELMGPRLRPSRNRGSNHPGAQRQNLG